MAHEGYHHTTFELDGKNDTLTAGNGKCVCVYI